jgi:hypothetical protein
MIGSGRFLKDLKADIQKTFQDLVASTKALHDRQGKELSHIQEEISVLGKRQAALEEEIQKQLDDERKKASSDVIEAARKAKGDE